ncbi:hypothetical protein DXG03_008968 [Asterophora parasitica]|uniref:UreD-domain-containing protein n=1 Tax=Asterophora parasitica TaxID=117018 RepID=A0A9P7GE28_9AGAR|nr:hypothetical protein DXG03_008968 [Asterophora parasitica]
METPHPSPIPNILAGSGRISLTAYGSSAVLSELSSTYPLKLLSPRISRRAVAVVYLLSYGGGLVGGDQVELSVDVDSKTVLVLLSQGSTKVFKSRPEQRLASIRASQLPLVPAALSPSLSTATTQNMTFAVATEGALFLLPDPVTCFRSASYNQTQTFHLSRNASLVVLDWFTSGRMSMGEEWAFSRYYSANEVWLEGKRIAKDVVLLDKEFQDRSPSKVPPRCMADRLAPYSCYAMVIMCGPAAQNIVRHLETQYDQISVFKTRTPAEMLWSLSPMTAGKGAILRVAGKETEPVKRWLGQALAGLEETCGAEVYRRAFV